MNHSIRKDVLNTYLLYFIPRVRLIAVQAARFNAALVNACPSMNFVIRASDARMAVMNHHIFVIQNVFQAYSKRYGHRHDREVASIVHFNVEMVDAVRLPLCAQDVMDAVITVMSNIAAYAVSKMLRKILMQSTKTNTHSIYAYFRLSCTSHMSINSSMHLWRERKTHKF